MLMWLLRAWNCDPIHGILDVWTIDFKCLDMLLRRQWMVSSQTWIRTSDISWHSQRCLIGFRNGKLGNQSMVSAFILHEWLMTWGWSVSVTSVISVTCVQCGSALISEENRVPVASLLVFFCECQSGCTMPLLWMFEHSCHAEPWAQPLWSLQSSNSSSPVPPHIKEQTTILLLGSCPPMVHIPLGVRACALLSAPQSGHCAGRHRTFYPEGAAAPDQVLKATDTTCYRYLMRRFLKKCQTTQESARKGQAEGTGLIPIVNVVVLVTVSPFTCSLLYNSRWPSFTIYNYLFVCLLDKQNPIWRHICLFLYSK